MNQPEFQIKNKAEFKVNPEEEKNFSKIYEESCEEDIVL